jgi:hypothetical protein
MDPLIIKCMRTSWIENLVNKVFANTSLFISLTPLYYIYIFNSSPHQVCKGCLFHRYSRPAAPLTLHRWCFFFFFFFFICNRFQSLGCVMNSQPPWLILVACVQEIIMTSSFAYYILYCTMRLSRPLWSVLRVFCEWTLKNFYKLCLNIILFVALNF